MYGTAVDNQPYTYTVVPTGGVTILGGHLHFRPGKLLSSSPPRPVNYPLLQDTAMVQVFDDSAPGIVITSPGPRPFTPINHR
jgi:hypothetical protein